MKQFTLYKISLLTLLALVSCTDEDSFNASFDLSNHTIVAKIEESNFYFTSRTTVNTKNEVLWTKNDRIGVFGDQNTSNVPFTLSSVPNETSAEFKGTLQKNEIPLFAYYPYQAEASCTDKTLHFTLPSSYEYAGNSNAPMIGIKNEEGNLIFKHLCGLLKVTISNLSGDISQFKVTAEGEHPQNIAGTVRVQDITAENPILEVEEGTTTVTLNITANYFVSNNVFFVPLPVGTYERLVVSLIDKDGNTTLEKSISNLEIKRAVILDMPDTNIEKGVTPYYVPIDWEQTTITAFNPTTGEVALQFDKWMPDLKEGISTIVIPTETCYYIRVVEQIKKENNTVTLRTREGNMTDIFMNTEFTLSTTPMEIARSASPNIQTEDVFGVIHPTKIIASLADGSTEVLYDIQQNIQSRESFFPIQGVQEFFKLDWDQNNATIKDWGDAKLFWKTCEFKASLNGHFYFSFSSCIDLINGEVQIPKGDLLNFFYILSGDIEAALKLCLTAKKGYSAGLEYPLPLMENLFGPTGIYIHFMVGSVPVSIRVNSDILADAQIKAEAEASLTAGAAMDMGIKMGVEYIKDSPAKMISPKITTDFTVYKPELTVKGEAHAEATAYPEIQVSFYDFVATNISYRRYIKDDFHFGGNIGGDGSNTYAGWDNRLYSTEYIAADLSLDFAGMPLWESPELTWPSEIEETDLYLSPHEIKIDSPKENETFSQNDEIPVVVHVTDFSAYTQVAPNTTGAVVKFEVTEGIINQEFVFTDMEGKATVNWIPQKKDAKLTATVLDGNGNAITSVEFIPNIKSEIKVITDEATDIKDVESTLSGSISGRKPEGDFKYGFLYSTTEKEPNISNATMNEGKDTFQDHFTMKISSLLPNTTYYWRAFIIENNTPYYGAVKQFETTNSSEESPISVITGISAQITDTEATLSGTINGLGTESSYTYGIQLAPENNQETVATWQATANENGKFSIKVSSLATGTTYYWWAYAEKAGEYIMGERKKFVAKESENNDRNILIAFYNACGGDNWEERHKKNWCSDLPIHRWSGVSINENGRVSALILSYARKALTGNADFRGLTDLRTIQFPESSLSSLNVSGCTELQYIDCSNNALKEFSFEECEKLKEVNIENNQLSSDLDFSMCTDLENLRCSGNSITNINVAGCKKIATLRCGGNKLTSLDVSDCIALKELRCETSQLKQLNISGLSAIETLLCSFNQLTSLDVSKLISLKYLQCHHNKIQTLDVSNLHSLISLDCYDNLLTSLDLSSCLNLASCHCARNPQLTSLNASNLPKLEYLRCEECQIPMLNCEGSNNLIGLYCYKNQLKSLDISEHKKLKNLECQDNQIQELYVSGCDMLNWLNCTNNLLSSLDISNLTNLNRAYCENNKIQTLNAEGCINLELLFFGDNQVEGNSINLAKCTKLKALSAKGHYIKIYLPAGTQSNKLKDKFVNWGEYDVYKYREPDHSDGYQYPIFIYQ